MAFVRKILVTSPPPPQKKFRMADPKLLIKKKNYSFKHGRGNILGEFI